MRANGVQIIIITFLLIYTGAILYFEKNNSDFHAKQKIELVDGRIINCRILVKTKLRLDYL